MDSNILPILLLKVTDARREHRERNTYECLEYEVGRLNGEAGKTRKPELLCG